MPTVGGVLSRLTFTPAVAELPAWSWTVPEKNWSAPSVETGIGAGQDTTPLNASEQLNVIVRFELFHPAALGAGLTFAKMLGGVMSIFTVTEADALFPALSLAVPVTSWPGVSFDTFTGAGQEATPLLASEHVKVTVTGELFHPAAFGEGVIVAVMMGGTVSLTGGMTDCAIEKFRFVPAEFCSVPVSVIEKRVMVDGRFRKMRTVVFAPAASVPTDRGRAGERLVL